ncbi:MAG TPA: sulfite exporter TauE/SafE family protein [Pyrinomonadaceae bacterium]|nr:sulfite exporter TauE/SafE family protein [Pyrinomonadaceae bacterium]
MSTAALIVLIVVFFLTSVVGVVTGSNSLIAVPAMFQVGIEPRAAVATNMFALVFMAAGGSLPFIRQRRIDYKKISPMIVLTILSSAIGAALVGIISGDGIKLIVTGGMIAIAIFTLVQRNSGLVPGEHHAWTLPLTYTLVFVLGIYGGLFSGGYVTVLTAVCVGIAGMTYTEAVASTKVINVFSSGVATVVFMWQGLVDYRLGLILGITMFVGAYVGAHYATKLNDIWLRRVFLATILLLAIKTIYDLIY